MKEYGDEAFIALLREAQEEARNRDIQKGTVWSGGEELLFTEREILKKKLWIWLPEDFKIVGTETTKQKYLGENRPDIIYANPEMTVMVTFSRQKLAAGLEKEVSSFVHCQIQELYSADSIIEKKIVHAGGMEMECLIFVTPAIDTMIYNQMFFLPLEGKLLIGNCSCLAQEQDEWEELFGQMLASIRTVDVRTITECTQIFTGYLHIVSDI